MHSENWDQICLYNHRCNCDCTVAEQIAASYKSNLYRNPADGFKALKQKQNAQAFCCTGILLCRLALFLRSKLSKSFCAWLANNKDILKLCMISKKIDCAHGIRQILKHVVFNWESVQAFRQCVKKWKHVLWTCNLWRLQYCDSQRFCPMHQLHPCIICENITALLPRLSDSNDVF